MIHNYLDITERARTGAPLSKEDWDFRIIEKVQALVDKYELTWDKQKITDNNPDLADRIFKAGKELILDTGVYALSRGRIIELSEEEIEEGIHKMNRPLVMGEGKDSCTLFPRDIQDTEPPTIWAGNPGVPTPEKIFKASVKSWAQEPLVDLITCGSLVDVDGVNVESGEVSELIASRRELSYLRQVREEVGRPGMGMLAAESSVTEIGDLAATHPDLLRPCDSHLVAMFNELMIDQGNMIRAANSQFYGMANASLATVMVGGLAGDAPGAAVVQVASFLAANIVCLADYHLCHPIHIRYVATSAPGCMWLQSIVCQAFARNAPAVIVCDVYPKSGALTKELLYEVAANSLAITLSGGHLEGVGSADGSRPNGTGLEVRLMAEVAHAAVRQEMTMEEGNKIILSLLKKYEHVLEMEGGNPGQSIEEAYDLVTVKPVPQWTALYEEVKAELREAGINF
ncbi:MULTISPECIES: monomethylamine:corrinoid methyltransferase [unclassified Oceanispirochaeta]|uniref:monomethylamine:corrinoid methyltransferase n=1 Tax=unclassified Oceanispirochaeta TaxID=2635722 RepID=UPI000E094FA9|nr:MULTISPECIES: monomethylamine:corrinoid methyltransferase [unclassified Oceanispirochaeta]MBF9016618.1 monomethylamine:corrinoid methyltransferase [Oceanispirochaeta sp. M2]NPD73177.1 monomethylamine:corrinoid methyltransferase [Oceanispirochaeta sp. M1]RDG31273.1 monomethylamine:corrinoid methyltransferase [Oceanispirochaeta sp. M1]